MLLRILDILLPIFFIVALSYAYARWRGVDMRIPNRLNMEIFIPALLFSVLAQHRFQADNELYLGLGCILVIFGCGLISWLVAWLWQIDSRTLLTPMMFKNAANMGIPVQVLAFGSEHLSTAVLLFVLTNVLHFTLGAYLFSRRTDWQDLLRTPMIPATLLGVAVSLWQVPLPATLLTSLEMLGQMAVPLMLVGLGVRLMEVDFKLWRIGLLGGILSPLAGLAIGLLLVQILPLDKTQVGMLLLYSALPPAVINYMLADHYQQQPQLVASMVLLGNLLTLVTLPLALWLALPPV